MKRIILLLAIVLGIATCAVAGDKYYHDATVLPEAARTTIKNNFKGQVTVVKVEKTLGRVTEYEVVLSDGTNISFDSHGNWDDIEVSANAQIPASIIPDAITTYVKSNHKGSRIVGIEHKRSGYDVELNNGIEMKFDSNGRFLRYDD